MAAPAEPPQADDGAGARARAADGAEGGSSYWTASRSLRNLEEWDNNTTVHHFSKCHMD